MAAYISIHGMKYVALAVSGGDTSVLCPHNSRECLYGALQHDYELQITNYKCINTKHVMLTFIYFRVRTFPKLSY